jgi:hypothetical protein
VDGLGASCSDPSETAPRLLMRHRTDPVSSRQAKSSCGAGGQFSGVPSSVRGSAVLCQLRGDSLGAPVRARIRNKARTRLGVPDVAGSHMSDSWAPPQRRFQRRRESNTHVQQHATEGAM